MLISTMPTTTANLSARLTTDGLRARRNNSFMKLRQRLFRDSSLHLLDRLEAERFQPLLEHTRRQIAQHQSGNARGFVFGFEHGTVFVERGELSCQVVQIIAKKVRAIFLRDGFQSDSEIQQVLGEREFFRRSQLNVE